MIHSPEIAIRQLAKQIQTNSEVLDAEINSSIEKIIMLCVTDLSKYSNLAYNEELVKELIGLLNLDELRESKETYSTIRKFVRDILQLYLEEMRQSQMLKVNDQNQFELRLRQLGIILDFTKVSTDRSIIPDGNVVVYSIAVVFSVFFLMGGLVFMRRGYL